MRPVCKEEEKGKRVLSCQTIIANVFSVHDLKGTTEQVTHDEPPQLFEDKRKRAEKRRDKGLDEDALQVQIPCQIGYNAHDI